MATRTEFIPPARVDGHQLMLRRCASAVATLKDRVEIDAARQQGVPVLRGTRLKVSQLLAELAESPGIDEVADDLELDSDAVRDVLHCLSISLDRPLEGQSEDAGSSTG
jgi:uncharacterized protein (DUF433 family)